MNGYFCSPTFGYEWGFVVLLLGMNGDLWSLLAGVTGNLWSLLAGVTGNLWSHFRVAPTTNSWTGAPGLGGYFEHNIYIY